jgi:hypothetical protein
MASAARIFFLKVFGIGWKSLETLGIVSKNLWNRSE